MGKVGVGMISFDHMHADSYASCFKEIDSCELVGIADSDQNRGRRKAKRYSTAYMGAQELLDNPDIDAVCICSANSRHRDDVFRAAEAGKDIMLEKPIATSMEDGRAIIDKCRRQGVLLQVAFVMRYSPIAQAAKEDLESGSVGEILAMSGTNHGSMPGGWFVDRELSGGGAIMDHTVHVADLMNWFMDARATRVFARGGERLHPGLGIDDAGFVLVKYGHTVGSIDPSWSRPKGYPMWGDVTMRIFGSQKTVELDGFSQNLAITRQGDRYQLMGYGSNVDYYTCLDLVESSAGGREPSSVGRDGLLALEIALAAYRSIETGEPVDLPLE